MRRIAIAALLFVLCTTVLAARRLSIVYRGNLPSVNLFINGEPRGRLHRDQPRLVHALGRFVEVRLAHGRLESVRRVHILPFQIQRVVFDRPRFHGAIIRLEGRYDWAVIHVNGRPEGRVYRDQPLYLPLAPGRIYRIQAVRRAMIRGDYQVRIAPGGEAAVRRITFDF